MGLGVHKIIIKFYLWNIITSFKIRKLLLGFENALKILLNCDKRAIIPILTEYGARIGDNCDIEGPLLFHNCKDFQNLTIGNNCHIGKNCFFDLKGKIVIGNNVTISMQTAFITHLDVGKSKLRKIYDAIAKSILIHDHSYIGANSTILMGVHIAESTFIAAGSLIIRSTVKSTIWGGVPAKIIKKL